MILAVLVLMLRIDKNLMNVLKISISNGSLVTSKLSLHGAKI